MEVAGLCSVCGRGAIMKTCSFCGGLVCDEHYERVYGVCSRCLEGRLKSMPRTMGRK